MIVTLDTNQFEMDELMNVIANQITHLDDRRNILIKEIENGQNKGNVLKAINKRHKDLKSIQIKLHKIIALICIY